MPRPATPRSSHNPCRSDRLEGTDRDSDYELITVQWKGKIVDTSNCGGLILLQVQPTSIHNPQSQTPLLLKGVINNFCKSGLVARQTVPQSSNSAFPLLVATSCPPSPFSASWI